MKDHTNCSGGKHSKLSITALAAADTAGEKIPIFAIGRSKNSSCFKNIKSLRCRYTDQPIVYKIGERNKPRRPQSDIP